MDKKKILLLGGAGYLGQWIFDGLLMSHKYKVDIIDKKYYGNDLFSSLYFVGSDVRTDLQKIDINQYDSIINVAAIVGDGASKINPKIAEDTELIPLQYLKDNYKGFLIWTSSCSVYGDSGGSDILTESSNTNPLSPYAQIKLKGEQILKDRPNTLILRLGTLYGYSLSNRQRFDLVVNKFAIDCMSKKEITVFNGGQYRPLLFVSDAAKAIVKAIDNSDLRTKFSIYNLCEGNYTIDEIADIFHKTFKYPITINRLSASTFDTRNYRVSCDAGQKNGIFSNTSLKYVINSIINYFQTQIPYSYNSPIHYNEQWIKLLNDKNLYV